MQRKTIVVLGMHRSGTSAMARMLNLLGCDLPSTLMPEAPSNPKGHWESNAIMSLNDDILHSAGSMWSDWLEFNPAWYDSPVVDDFLERASTVLHAEYGMSPLFVLKDPRNCRLTRFWFDVLDRADVMPLVVIPLRNPLEVVDSLELRDGMHRDFAMLLWLRHVLDAEHGSRGRRRVFLTYENLLDDWVGVADRIQDGLGISWPRFSTLTAIDMEDFLDRGSRHHVRSTESVQSNRMLSNWVRDTDAILRRWATSQEHPDEHVVLDDIRQQLNAAGPAFGKLTFAVSSERYQNLELRALLQAKEGELTQLTNEILQLRDAQAAHDDQVGNMGGLETKVEHLENVRHELEIEKSVLENDLARLRAHAETVEADLRATMADKEAGVTAFDAAQQDLEKLSQELADIRHELNNVQSTLRQREEEIAQTLSSLDSEHQRLAQAEAERIAAEERLEATEAKLSDANAWVFRLAGERKNSEEQVALVQSRLTTTEKALSYATARLADVQTRYLDPIEKANLFDQIDALTTTVATLRVQNEKARQGWNDTKSEVVALSKLLQRRQAELAEGVAIKEQLQLQLEKRDQELSVLADNLRVQREEAEQFRKSAQSEIVSLSRLLKQRQTEFIELSKSGGAHDEKAQRDESLQSEIVMLSKLLKQREAELASSRSSGDVPHLSQMLKEKEEVADQNARHAEWLKQVNAVVTGYPLWWAFVPKNLREKWQNGRLLRRGLFDADSYLARYPDVSSSGINPLRHYIIHGINERRTF